MVVFLSITPHRHERPKDKGHWCDTSSIGSTFSKNNGLKFLNSNNRWCVVPSGGAKASVTNKDNRPRPCCRYDEQEQYLTAICTANKKPTDRTKVSNMEVSKSKDTNHPLLKIMVEKQARQMIKVRAQATLEVGQNNRRISATTTKLIKTKEMEMERTTKQAKQLQLLM